MRLVGSGSARAAGVGAGEAGLEANDGAVCWVCCCGSGEDDEAEAPRGPLVSTGCACRGSGGLAHLACLVDAATHDVYCWTSCPTCKQHFTGEMEVNLAKARWARVQDRPPEDPERLFVANNLAVTLQESAGDYEEALKLLEEVLAVRRRELGDEHPDTLDSITNLALHHMETGRYAPALALSEEVVAATRKQESPQTSEEVAHSICSLAAVHNLMGNFALAEKLHTEALGMREALLGPAHVDTLNSMYGRGHALAGLGRWREALALLEAVAATSRRVLGEAHPTAAHFAAGLAAAVERERAEGGAGAGAGAGGAHADEEA